MFLYEFMTKFFIKKKINNKIIKIIIFMFKSYLIFDKINVFTKK